MLWPWILIAVIVVAGAAVVAYFLLSGNDGGQAGDGPQPGGQATVSVQTGRCDPATGTAPIVAAIDPPGAATITVTASDGFEQTFTGEGGSSPVGPGEYSWTAQPSEGVTITGGTAGTLTVAACDEVLVDFTLEETDLLNHVPSEIRASCQKVPAEQQVGRASASLLCEHRGVTLFYDLFSNTADMAAYYDARVREFGVPRSSGFCDSEERAENAYVRKRGNRSFEVGRLLCFRDEGNAIFVWSDQRVDITVEAQRGDPTNDRLYRLWARVEFGPLL